LSDQRNAAPDDDDDVAARIVSLLKIGAPLAVVLLAIGLGVARGAPLAILVLAAGALAAVIALFWQSVRTLVGETPLSGADAFAIAAPRAEEEKKRAVLRALKDLEFERSVGKISAADYDELVLQYRAQARALLQQIDESAKPRRDRVMELVEDRLRKAGLAGGMGEVIAVRKGGGESESEGEGNSESGGGREGEGESEGEGNGESERGGEGKSESDASAEEESDDAEEKADEKSEGEARASCAACSASNELDAAFCKKCGATMTHAPQVEAEPDAT
jgi:hypothetical protein